MSTVPSPNVEEPPRGEELRTAVGCPSEDPVTIWMPPSSATADWAPWFDYSDLPSPPSSRRFVRTGRSASSGGLDSTQPSSAVHEPPAPLLPPADVREPPLVDAADDHAAAMRMAAEEDDGETPECCLFPLSRKIGVSPTIPIRALYYAIVGFYLTIGFRRVAIRYEDLEYQREFEPELLDWWKYVPQIVVDLLLFVSVPFASAATILLLDLTFTFNGLVRLLDYFWPSVHAYFFLFTQSVVLVHVFLETLNLIFQFYEHIDEAWFWALMTYRLAVFSFYLLLFQYTYTMGYTAAHLKKWAMHRFQHRLQRPPRRRAAGGLPPIAEEDDEEAAAAAEVDVTQENEEEWSAELAGSALEHDALHGFVDVDLGDRQS